MFHIGHLKLIDHAKEYCDYLTEGVNSDALAEAYKHKIPDEEILEKHGVDLIFLPHTEGISSTMPEPESDERIEDTPD